MQVLNMVQALIHSVERVKNVTQYNSLGKILYC